MNVGSSNITPPRSPVLVIEPTPEALDRGFLIFPSTDEAFLEALAAAGAPAERVEETRQGIKNQGPAGANPFSSSDVAIVVFHRHSDGDIHLVSEATLSAASVLDISNHLRLLHQNASPRTNQPA